MNAPREAPPRFRSFSLRLSGALSRLCLAVVIFLPAAGASAAPSLKFSAAAPPLEQGLSLYARADQAPPDFPPAGDAVPDSAADRTARTASDWAGLSRDTAYLIGYQLLAYGILYVAPESVSNWSVEQKSEYRFSRWVHNATHPEIDTDQFYINYILHPYWGSAYYLDARGRGFGRWGSFAFAFFASGLYEFGTEAFMEPASIQDIFVTPIAGALLGIALEGVWQNLIDAGESRNWAESVLLALIDPIGRTNHAVDRLLGFSSDAAVVRLLPSIRPAPGRGTVAGVELSMHW